VSALQPKQPEELGLVAQAKMFAQSELVPKHYRNSPANVLVALDYARHIGEPALAVMQATFIVHGTLGFKAEYLIGRANASGIFSEPIQYEEEGSGSSYRVRAGAPIRDKMLWGPWVGAQMAKAEGWSKNSKYQSMPELMYRYRAATFFVRQTCPQVVMGARTVEEIQDVAASQGPREVKLEAPAALAERVRPTTEPVEVVEVVAVEEAAPAEEPGQARLAFAVCPSCDGDGCRACEGTGEVLA
jgi:hypothetical protein